MFLDSRVIGQNTTAASRDQWAADYFPRIELIWGYMILLHFARLIPLDPLVLHFLCILWKFMPSIALPTLSDIELYTSDFS